jgi:integrase
MPRPRNVKPSYLQHKQSGRARAVWTNAIGLRQFRMLPGPFNSPESLAAFAKLQLELATAVVATPTTSDGLTVNELLLAYLTHAEQHYRAEDGTPTDEIRHLKTACRHVRELYGTTPAAQFGPKALKAVRQRFVELNWSRKTVNARTERVRRIFKWAVAEELVPPAVHQALVAVAGLQRGRTSAPETEAIKPVDDATIDATLPFLNRHVRGLVEFQRLTGCRPGEACALRRRDIEMSGTVWLFRPAHHKTKWKGKARTIAVGPKAQDLIRGYFTDDPKDHLFSPRRAVAEWQAERSANRKTPRYPSHMARNKQKRATAR